MAADKNRISRISRISRVTRSKDKARTSYNRMSKWYDIMAGNAEKKYKETGLTMLNVTKGETVLEIGFGTGHGILSLAKTVGSSGKVHGIDLSEGMRDVTYKKLTKAALSDNVQLECGDAASLPFEPGVFDAIFMSFTLELFDTPEIPTILAECKRVLNNDGRICIVSMSKKGKQGLMMKLYEWFHEKFPVSVDCRPIYVHEALTESGFHILNEKIMPMWGLPVEIIIAAKKT